MTLLSQPEESKPETVEHTPTPWRAIDRIVVVTIEDHGFATWIADCSVGGSGFGTQTANAQFLVRAVNNHDDLLAALEALIDVADAWIPRFYAEEIATLDAAKRAAARANGAAS